MEDQMAELQAEVQQINIILQEFSRKFQNIQDIKIRMESVEESLHKALGTLVQKVDRLLAREDASVTTVTRSARAHVDPLAPSASLLAVAESGDSMGLLRLLLAGADTQQRNQNGDTALHVAIAKGHLEATIVLLGWAPAVNSKGQRMRTPLHCAAMHGHLRIADRLLASEADVNSKDGDGATPLALAASGGHADVATLLLDMGASIDETDNTVFTPLQRAIKEKHGEVVKLLLRREASATKCRTIEECALILAMKSGESTIVSDISRNWAASNIGQVKQAVSMAENPIVVRACLQELPENVLPEVIGYGLVCSVLKGNVELLATFLDGGIHVDRKFASGETVLQLAAQRGQVDCLRELLRRGASVGVTNSTGNSSLHEACRMGQVECARVLLAAGANVNQRNNAGHTAVQLAKSDNIRQLFNKQN